MKQLNLRCPIRTPRKIATTLLQLAMLTLAFTITVPLRAADEHSDRPVKQRVAPVYPDLAKRMRISGVVRVSATVAADGTVSASKAVNGNRMLTGAAEDAVRKWKFAAASDSSIVEVQVEFALQQ